MPENSTRTVSRGTNGTEPVSVTVPTTSARSVLEGRGRRGRLGLRSELASWPSEWEKRLVGESVWHRYSRHKRVAWLVALAAVATVTSIGTGVLLGASGVEVMMLTAAVPALLLLGLAPIVLAKDEAALRALWIIRTVVLVCFAVVIVLVLAGAVVSLSGALAPSRVQNQQDRSHTD